MPDLAELEKQASLVVSEYAYTIIGDEIHVINLRKPLNTMIFKENLQIIESTMSGLERDRVIEFYMREKFRIRKH